MKQNLSEDLYDEENNEIIPIQNKVQKNKFKNYFDSKFGILFIILDIISCILMIIFMIISYKVLFWIFFSITFILTCIILTLIIIICKENQEVKKKEMKKEPKIILLEERKKKKEEIVQKHKKYMEDKTEVEKVNEVLEDMCILGSIMKEEIVEEKKNNPEKFISIEEATKEENKENGTFCLGIVAQTLENMGITTAIEKEESNDEKSKDTSSTVLQFMMNGMMEKKKYDLHFDLGEERNNELLTNKEEQKKFNQKLRKKLSIEYNVPEDTIIVTNVQRGSYRVQVIFEKEDFNKNVDINSLAKNCDNNEFQELKNLKEVHSSLIMEGCKLSPDMLDSRGNRESGWGENEKRGGFDYIPPKGWKGFGLKVWDKYDKGNNYWLAYDGNPNEWAVAYHGIGCRLGSTGEKATNSILKGGFKAGEGQAYKNYQNDNPRYKKDNNGNDYSIKIGKGVYCSPDPSVMEEYASQANTKAKANGKNYLMGFMMRVKPDKIRYSNSQNDYWVLDGTTNEMRPYRIMVKQY